jgi:hypothetical protein
VRGVECPRKFKKKVSMEWAYVITMAVIQILIRPAELFE